MSEEKKVYDGEKLISNLGSKKDKNGKAYYEFWFDDDVQKRYSWFASADPNAAKTYDLLKKGDLVHVYWEEQPIPNSSGVYRNVKSIAKMDGGQNSVVKSAPDRSYWERKDRVMTKLGVLKDAIAVFDIQQKTGDIKAMNKDMVFALAEDLLERVLQDGGFYKAGEVKEEKVGE